MNTAAAYLLDETGKQLELYVEPVIIDDRQQLKFHDNGETIATLRTAGKYSQDVATIIQDEADRLGVEIEEETLIIYPDDTKYIDSTAQAAMLAQLIAEVRRMVFFGYIS